MKDKNRNFTDVFNDLFDIFQKLELHNSSVNDAIYRKEEPLYNCVENIDYVDTYADTISTLLIEVKDIQQIFSNQIDELQKENKELINKNEYYEKHQSDFPVLLSMSSMRNGGASIASYDIDLNCGIFADNLNDVYVLQEFCLSLQNEK